MAPDENEFDTPEQQELKPKFILPHYVIPLNSSFYITRCIRIISKVIQEKKMFTVIQYEFICTFLAK